MQPPNPTFRSKLYERLRGEIVIDQMRIPEELIASADLVMSCAEHCAEAMAARDRLANDVKVVTARRAAQFRKRVVAGKARSETEIKSLVEGDPDVAEATEAFEQARTDAALWSALVNAAQLKHSSLKKAADLMLGGFLTTTHIVGNRRKELNEGRKRRRDERESDNADDD